MSQSPAEENSELSELECLQMKYGMMRTTYEVEIRDLRATLAAQRGLLNESLAYVGCPAWSPSLHDEILSAVLREFPQTKQGCK